MSQAYRDVSTIESSCPSIDNSNTDEYSYLFTSTQNSNTSRTPPIESELPPNSVSDETQVKGDGSADNKDEITELRLNAVTIDLSEEKRLKGNHER